MQNDKKRKRAESRNVTSVTSASHPIGAWDRRAHFRLEYTHSSKYQAWCPAKKSHLQLREGSPQSISLRRRPSSEPRTHVSGSTGLRLRERYRHARMESVACSLSN